jgi:hypothetical protein
MDLTALGTGARLLLEDGSAVEVVEPSADGVSIRVRYLDSPFNPELVGTEGNCTDYEIASETNADSSDTPVSFA